MSKIKLYKNKSKDKNYMIPSNIKKYIEVEDWEMIKQMVENDCQIEMEEKIKYHQELNEYIKDKTIPDFLLDPTFFDLKGGRKYAAHKFKGWTGEQ